MFALLCVAMCAVVRVVMSALVCAVRHAWEFAECFLCGGGVCDAKLILMRLTWVKLQFNFRTKNQKQGSMHKVQLNCLSLTWVWLKLSFQLKTDQRTHVKIQTHVCVSDLSLNKTPYTRRSNCKVIRVWLKLRLQFKTMQELNYKTKNSLCC